jgi:phosphonatase-like hydrolase
MIELAVVDLAGTTVSDDGIVEDSFLEAISESGLVGASREEALRIVRATMGRSKIEVFRMIFNDEESADRANVRFEKAYQRHIDEGSVRPIPGAEEVLGILARNAIHIVFTTGFSPITRDTLLSRLNWASLAEMALSPEDVGRGRPHPDMILTAVLKLGVGDVANVAVVGDNPDDLEAGARAGASIVAGVLTGTSDEARLREARHTHIIPTIASFPDLLP